MIFKTIEYTYKIIIIKMKYKTIQNAGGNDM